MKTKIIIFLVILGPLLGLGLASIYLWKVAKTPYQGQEAIFKVEPGQGFASINYQLSKNNFIPNAKLFHYYTKYTDSINKFKTGVYQIEPGMTMFDIHEILTKGISKLIKITIPEGKNLYQIAQLLEDAKITNAQKFISACKSKNLLKKYKIPGPSFEGFLFPETYFFSPQSRPQTIIDIMYKEFQKQTKDISFNYRNFSKFQLLTLASIVEKETGAKFERKKIAGVFHNRLKKRMRLQSDPTTIYGIYENFDGNLKRHHLREKTPYNTYAISGLPHGPISNPGLDAIKAVIDPEKHQYLYFVSRNDGTHVFSKTYKEHDKAVDHFQRTRANREGKSWRDLKQ